MSPRKHSEKRVAILNAATAAFCELGYESASMDRIAEVASVSKRTVYNHYASKEILFRAVVSGLIEETHALKQIPWNPDRELAVQLREFAEAKVRVAADSSLAALLRVVIGVLVRQPELAQEVMSRAKEGDDALAVWLRAADQAGRMDVPKPAAAADLFWSMILGAIYWPTLLGAAPSATERRLVIDEIVETFLARFRRDGD